MKVTKRLTTGILQSHPLNLLTSILNLPIASLGTSRTSRHDWRTQTRRNSSSLENGIVIASHAFSLGPSSIGIRMLIDHVLKVVNVVGVGHITSGQNRGVTSHATLFHGVFTKRARDGRLVAHLRVQRCVFLDQVT